MRTRVLVVICGGLLLLLLPLHISAQSGPTVPTTCTVGDLFTLTNVTPNIVAVCLVTNLWTATLPTLQIAPLADDTYRNVTTAAHGLFPKLPGGTTTFFRADGAWTTVTASAAWGGITGTLSTQTDLQTALDAKAVTGHSHAAGDVTGTAVLTADARLSDARTPTAHSHPESEVTGLVADLAAKAPLASPAFTGTPTGLLKAHVGLANADNTTDAGKPVSTAQQTALDLKALIASPSFTGATLTLADAQDVIINATTGSKFGQTASKIGWFGVTPAVRPTAITQTYATASATHANVTQLAAPAGGTGATAGAYSTAANRDLMIASINAARADIANVKQVLNAVIDKLQALGLLQ